MYNLIEKTDFARAKNSFTDGLSLYTQTNCSCTLEKGIYKIYRPANKTTSDDGNTMWGGLVLKPYRIDADILQKYHRYVIKFEVKGKSSNNVAETSWNNQVGWNGGGLTPTPSDVVTNKTDFGTDFQSDDWMTFSYAWTINDDVYKVCTSSYSSFVQGETYISYRDFKFGFVYTNTGAMGTELYLKNFRMYDITDSRKNNSIVTKLGVINPINIVEDVKTSTISNVHEMTVNGVYEN